MSFKENNGKVQTMEIHTSEVIKKQGHRAVYVIDHASVGLPPPGIVLYLPKQLAELIEEVFYCRVLVAFARFGKLFE
jgi:hypothetical protein